MNDVSLMGWATGIEVVRGWQDISNPQFGLADFGTPQDALGPAQGGTNWGVVSLGDGGVAILTFEKPIANGPGWDFAVFENSFDGRFLELAFVEVSSDGVNYQRFPAVSLTQTETQIATFGTLDPTYLYHLAGKYQAGYGTPFDLDQIKDVNPLVDVTRITHVRIVDVVGSLNEAYCSYDSQGNKINDPWPTPFGTGGFDLDAVGVRYQKNRWADKNGDGIVNLKDFALLSGLYQQYADWIDDFLDEWLLTEPWYQGQ